MTKYLQSSKPRKGAPSLRKALSTPSMMAPETSGGGVPFPIDLQVNAATIRKEMEPERWMCVVRREKLTQAVGRIVQVPRRA